MSSSVGGIGRGSVAIEKDRVSTAPPVKSAAWRHERVDALMRGGRQFLRNWPTEIPRDTVDSGLRPMTPDGMPIIGTMPGVRNLTISTGHQMLGLVLAPASADQLAELIVTGKTPPVLEPFSPTRF